MQALVDKTYFLQKFPGKGGWTYAAIPEIPQDRKVYFGWVKVRGTIDGFEIRKYHLMPMGNGQLFLPVKADIRKKIGKQAGDSVHIILYPDNEPLDIPEEFLSCLQDEPAAHKYYNTLSDSVQLQYIKWIYSAKTDDLKVARLVEAINELQKGTHR
jgi:hypothetical protein